MGTTASQLGKDLLSEYQVSAQSKEKINISFTEWLKLKVVVTPPNNQR